jgi:hypothetical protein
MTRNDLHFAISDVRIRFTQLLDHIECETPRALTERLRKAEIVMAKTRELIAAMPVCDQGCGELAAYGRSDGAGRRCEEHATAGWHAYPRARVQAELIAALMTSEETGDGC